MMNFYRDYIKPIADWLVATTAFVVILPVFLVLTVILAAVNQGKPFFFQHRPGKNEKIFRIVKFKTMNDKKDAEGNLLPDTERLTKAGMFVRRTSLDEIPQLINVILGHMSLIGPRPLLPEYLPLYTEHQRKRHWVKPGITGWAQVNGRNTISWEEKFDLDVWYVQNCSFKLDLRIIGLTIKKVLVKEGISAEGHLSMPRFDEEIKKQKN